jgi:hypothetical protein
LADGFGIAKEFLLGARILVRDFHLDSGLAKKPSDLRGAAHLRGLFIFQFGLNTPRLAAFPISYFGFRYRAACRASSSFFINFSARQIN